MFVDRPKTVDRLSIAKLALLFVFVVLVSRLGYLQLIEGLHYQQLADGNRIRMIPVRASRGVFYDRNGIPLVSDRPSFSIAVFTFSDHISNKVIDKLSQILAMSPVELRTKLSRHQGLPYEPILLKIDVGPEIVAKIEENRNDLPDVFVRADPVRNYMRDNVAAHVFGYVGEISADELRRQKKDGYRSGDIVGKSGLEKVYDQFIRGTDGGERIEVDVNGQPLQILNKVPPRPGNNLVLTLDYAIQQAAEFAIDKQLRYLQTKTRYHNAKAAAVVAMNPNTGEILAIASRPVFDPNLFNGGISSKNWQTIVNNPLSPMENRAIAGEYPPGSVFKIITGTAALELGKVTIQEKILDTGRHWLIPKGNAGGEALGWIGFKEALAKSDNVYFYEMGNRVGIDKLEKYARMYGLGAVTGIELPGEAEGLVANRQYKEEVYGEEWYLSETFDAAIGQGFQLVTPLQMAMVMGEVANGGVRYRPYLVDKIVSPDGELLKKFKPQQTGHINISRQSLAVIREALHESSLPGGTAASAFAGFPIPIAGKTGTAENPHGDDHGWFVAYAPLEKPRIVVAVIVEQGGFGSQAAAPIARNVLEAVFLRENRKNQEG